MTVGRLAAGRNALEHFSRGRGAHGNSGRKTGKSDRLLEARGTDGSEEDETADEAVPRSTYREMLCSMKRKDEQAGPQWEA